MRPLWNSFTYFAHQEEGVEWMLKKEISGTIVSKSDGTNRTTVYGGFQCDDMGLGKTIQIVSVLVNNPKRLTLIVAPLAMIDTWSTICDAAGMNVFQLKKHDWVQTNPDVEIPDYFIKMQPSIYITNYDKVINSPVKCNKDWNRIVLDEAHTIRNGKSVSAFCMRRLRAPIRWAVTGTPLVNSLSDVVSLMTFIGVPCTPGFRWEQGYYQILPELLIHRSLESLRAVLSEAPPLPEIIHEVLPFTTPEEEEFYMGVQCTDNLLNMKYARDVLTSSQTFLLLLRLRQLAVHPQVYINAKRREDSTYDRDAWDGSCTKFERVLDIIENDDDTRVHKYIVFCQFREEMELFQTYLTGWNLEVLLYNGSMNQDQRTAVLARSKETTHTTVLLIQLQAGGVGLNLQEYDRIIFVSPWWTSALMDQAIARAVRMGQKEVVKVYHLRLECETPNPGIINIDEHICQKADEKRRMLEKVFAECAATIAAQKEAQKAVQKARVPKGKLSRKVIEMEEEPGSIVEREPGEV